MMGGNRNVLGRSQAKSGLTIPSVAGCGVCYDGSLLLTSMSSSPHAPKSIGFEYDDVVLSRHYAAVIDGVLHDVVDCSRGGTRCVYGYYSPDDGR
jgi:hypothetical protein